MTLEEAIAEVDLGRPWDSSDFQLSSLTVSISTFRAAATILNAVASGQLVRKADADLAVAEALRKAGEVADGWVRRAMHLSPNGYEIERAHGHMADKAVADIKQIANQDHLAEVQALKTERDSFRAVLEGAGYGDIDGIAKNTPEMSRTLGDAVMHLTLRQRARAEAAKAEVARLREALQEIADMDGLQDWQPEAAACVNIALAALTPKGDTP